MTKEFNKLEWYDEEIWELIARDVLHKSKVQNLHFFHTYWSVWHEVNENPKCPLYGKFTQHIESLKKFYKEDFEWRYDLENRRFRTYKELVTRRDDPVWETYNIRKLEVDQAAEARKKEEERKQQRFLMAKYSKELMIEIVQEMMDQSKTVLEMMVELDCTEQSILEA
jgi:hypothetical protein